MRRQLRNVIVTLGAEGVIAPHAKHAWRDGYAESYELYPAVPAASIVSVTGAGDRLYFLIVVVLMVLSLAGGMIAALMHDSNALFSEIVSVGLKCARSSLGVMSAVDPLLSPVWFIFVVV